MRKSIYQSSTRLRMQNIPHFSLSKLTFIFFRISIVRMHLNGKIFLRINQFNQDR